MGRMRGESKIALKDIHTFSMDVFANSVLTAYTKEDLVKFWQCASNKDQPVLVLGGGSNILFLEDYAGLILLNRIEGITVKEGKNSWYLHVGAGEKWHSLVTYCLKKRIVGLENLALIPGYVGSAPIQNIGAYGMEFAQVCDYVDLIQLENGIQFRLSAEECQFDYRDSIFKHQFRDRYAVVSVGIRLDKYWKPKIDHRDLRSIESDEPTPKDIYDMVCKLRSCKLPHPSSVGNAGCFFKNPIVDITVAKHILKQYPDTPNYLQPNGKIRIFAGWLIEACGLKGHRSGGAMIYDKQASIIINVDRARSEDVIDLMKYIHDRVERRFNIRLEPEVRLIGSQGEVDVSTIFK